MDLTIESESIQFMKKFENLQVTGVQCPNCLDIIVSRHHYDCHYCTCGESMIDGGRDYTRVGYKTRQPYPVTIELIGFGEIGLLSAYNRLSKLYGTIKTRRIVYDMLYRYTLNEKGKFYRYVKKS